MGSVHSANEFQGGQTAQDVLVLRPQYLPFALLALRDILAARVAPLPTALQGEAVP